jgi:manganese/zinc/iron transport system permease protein
MMDTLFRFLSFDDANVRLVTLGTVLLGAAAAVVGAFAYLRKRSLVGDAIAHAVLPGVVLAFVLVENKNPLALIGGALFSGWLALLSIDGIRSYSKLKLDTIIGLVLSVFFGFGIFMLTAVQHSGLANQAGLDKFLFGKAASMSPTDIYAFAGLSALLLLLVTLFYKAFKIVSFNRDYAITLGLPVKLSEFVLSTLTVLAVTTGIQAVGVVLMAALLITPAAAARSWTDRLLIMLVLAAAFGALGGLVGSFISYSAPRMPTGPWIVMSLSFFALFSLLFAPKRGVLAKVYKQRKNREKIITENLLKALYVLGERQGNPQCLITEKELKSHRSFGLTEFPLAIRKLQNRLLIIANGSGYRLSDTGLTEAARVVRLHRLWEMYLTTRMNMRSDHIHPNAETVEHIITPELEAELIKELNRPRKDPHESEIPYN